MNETIQHWKVNIVCFLISQGITLFGSQIVQMSIVWYVTKQTESGAWVASISIASYLPQFLISFAGGILADRYNRKQLIVLSDTLIALVTLLFMICAQLITDDFNILNNLVGLSVIRSAAAGIQNPAVNAAVVDLVPDNEYMRYNGINAVIQSFVQFVSPAAAVIALSTGSLRSVFMIDVITAVVGILVLCQVCISDAGCIRNSESVLSDILYGIRYALNKKDIRNTLILYSQFLWWSIPGGYLADLYVSRTYGDSYWHLTLVEIVGFGGMLLGGVLLSSVKAQLNRMRIVTTGLIAFGFMSIAMSICHIYGIYLLCMLVYGIALTVIQTTITTILQELSVHDMRGRIFGLMSSIYASIYPLGMTVFGTLSDILPLTWLMTMSGIALILISVMNYMRYNTECLR